MRPDELLGGLRGPGCRLRFRLPVGRLSSSAAASVEPGDAVGARPRGPRGQLLLLREMEYDADRYTARWPAATRSAETRLRLQELNLAESVAVAALNESWRAQRLPDSLPQLIVGTFPEIPPDVREEASRMAAGAKTGLFDTHPCDADRIRAAELLDAPGIVRSTDPATALFRDFAALGRKVTRLSYQKDQALPIQDANLVDTETYLRETRSLRATRAQSERYFAGVSSVFHPISIGLPELQPTSDPGAGLAELRSARDRMKAAVSRGLRPEAAGADPRASLQCRDRARAVGGRLRDRPGPVRVQGRHARSGEEAIARLEDGRRQSAAPLLEYSARAEARLRAALRELGRPSPGAAHRRRARPSWRRPLGSSRCWPRCRRRSRCFTSSVGGSPCGRCSSRAVDTRATGPR